MKNNFILLLLVPLISLLSCSDSLDANQNKSIHTHENDQDHDHQHRRTDVHSFAEPDKAKTKHLSLDLKVDFDTKVLTGKASYTIENNKANKIIFDTRDLDIQKVTIGKVEKETTFKVGVSQAILGNPLEIAIEPNTNLVHIYYKTSPKGAAALDWLEPQQTADKKHPFLFTQGQAILTRTWVPCQDSPGIRITYDATVQVPKDLMAVMSASNPQKKNPNGIYTFEMKQAIPPYLMALAIGDIEFAPIGERTGVYAEPSVLKSALYEFGDMEKMLIAAENMYGTYDWDRYDVIVLPPSFPFGGMENPRLTFATPTIIAGDRSLTALIAHELAHSWSGNLVTNATWDDFWLNEGFTVYFERRIMEDLYGKDYMNMLALLGFQDLEADVADLDPKDTHLKLDLNGRDPDDGMTDIAYEKGCFFLTLLEEKVGREKFDVFLKNYFSKHKFQTLTTEEFVVYLKANLLDKHQVDVNIDEWIYGPGIPANCPKIISNKFDLVDKEVERIVKKGQLPTAATKEWTTHEWLHFLRHLPQDLDLKKMAQLEKAYQFSDSGNSEILAAWFELSIKNGYSKNNVQKIENFLVSVGRRKFLTPLYRAFKESDQLDLGRKIYAKAKPNYHAVSRGTMEKLLDL